MRMLLLFLAILLSCGQDQPKHTAMSPDTAASDGLQIPDAWAAQAPSLQAQLMQVLNYDTPAFQVKPLFVFVDDGRLVTGPFSALVTHFTFVHVALFEKGRLAWSGSLLMDPNRGTAVTSLSGHEFDVIPEASTYRLELRWDGQLTQATLARRGNDFVNVDLGNERHLFAARLQLPNERPIRP